MICCNQEMRPSKAPYDYNGDKIAPGSLWCSKCGEYKQPGLYGEPRVDYSGCLQTRTPDGEPVFDTKWRPPKITPLDHTITTLKQIYEELGLPWQD